MHRTSWVAVGVIPKEREKRTDMVKPNKCAGVYNRSSKSNYFQRSKFFSTRFSANTPLSKLRKAKQKKWEYSLCQNSNMHKALFDNRFQINTQLMIDQREMIKFGRFFSLKQIMFKKICSMYSVSISILVLSWYEMG